MFFCWWLNEDLEMRNGWHFNELGCMALMMLVFMYIYIRVAKLRNFCLCSSKSQPQTLIYGEK